MVRLIAGDSVRWTLWGWPLSQCSADWASQKERHLLLIKNPTVLANITKTWAHLLVFKMTSLSVILQYSNVFWSLGTGQLVVSIVHLWHKINFFEFLSVWMCSVNKLALIYVVNFSREGEKMNESILSSQLRSRSILFWVHWTNFWSWAWTQTHFQPSPPRWSTFSSTPAGGSPSVAYTLAPPHSSWVEMRI